MSVNTLRSNGEFEQTPEREKTEIEKQYTTADPHFFDFMKPFYDIQNIEQIYLSDLYEPNNLRVREITYPDGTIRYTGALKGEGRVLDEGLARDETPATVISQDTFALYQNSDRPRLFKERIEPFPGVTIDWVKDYPLPIIEIENLSTNEAGQLFLQQYGSVLIDRTGMKDVDNEWIAHMLSGKEEEEAPKQMSVEEMAKKVLGYRSYGISPIVVTIDGRSGSGKTTYARQLAGLLKLSEGEPVSTTVLSTDNYHRGKSWLEAQNDGKPWQNWDESIVYDTKELSIDIARLRAGESIENRFFSFDDQECHFEGTISPAEIIIIEGIHAGTRDLEGIRHFHFPIETPLATSIGRDLSRLREGDRPNSTIGSTSERLAYQLEYAEPAFQKIERVSKKNLKAFRHTMGKKVVQIRNGEFATRQK